MIVILYYIYLAIFIFIIHFSIVLFKAVINSFRPLETIYLGTANHGSISKLALE